MQDDIGKVAPKDVAAAAAAALEYGESSVVKVPSRRSFLAMAGAAALAGPALVAACSPSNSTASSASSPALVGDVSKQKYYWIAANISDPFYVDGKSGMEAFGKMFGVQTAIVGPGTNDMAGMTTAFQEIVAKPDCTGIFSYYYADFAGGAPIYEQAAQKKIPIINGASDWGGPRLGWIGVRDQDTPAAAVDALAKALNEKGSVGYIGNTGSNIIKEEKWFEQLVAKYPNMHFAGHATYDGSEADGVKQYQAFVNAHPGLNAMFWGDSSGGAIAKTLTSSAPNVKLLIRGLGKPALDAVQSKVVIGTLDRQPFDEEFWGFIALYMAVNHKIRPPDTMVVSTLVVTPDNIGPFLADPHHLATTYV